MPAPTPTPTASTPVNLAQVKAVRSFNRFYTHRAGVLALSPDMALTETRVLYELAHSEHCIASELCRYLGVDNGYLSRILKRFEAAGWMTRSPNPRDQRQSLLSLTFAGHQAYAPVDATSQKQQTEMLSELPAHERAELVSAMATIERILSPPSSTTTTTTAATTTAPKPTASLRNLAIGDLGWILETHAVQYADEFGWVDEFEGVIAEVCVDIARMDPSCERGWIAEVGGQRVGCIFLMKARDGVAKIRLVFLTAAARGHGLGNRLVDESIRFAQEKGYTKIELWTHQNLTLARNMYAKRGFRLVATEPHGRFGIPLVGEMWEMDL